MMLSASYRWRMYKNCHRMSEVRENVCGVKERVDIEKDDNDDAFKRLVKRSDLSDFLHFQ